ncbi:MAG: DUF2806 domain-containing protein [Rhizobiales bacterium]|nr:DUF2806 domain-containing protein [Hyphomicrobiales bacterium]
MGEHDSEKLPSLGQLIEAKLGFKLPTLALPQTAKNLDRAVARLVLAGSDNLAARIDRNTASLNARSQADAKLIEGAGDVARSALDSIEDRAEKFATADAILKQENRESIVRGAIEQLSMLGEEATESASEISQDWLNSFSATAENKSSDEIRSLFSRILAGEIRAPGSFSLRSLSLLSTIDQVDAVLIHKIFGYVILGQLIFKDIAGIKFIEYLKLENMSVLDGASGSGLSLTISNELENIKITYQNKIIFVDPHESKKIKFSNICILTDFGSQLYNLFENYIFDDEYVERIASEIRPQTKSIEVADILMRYNDGSIAHGPRLPV